MFWPKQGRQYCGFLTIHWIPIFVDFVVALIHNIKFQFLIIYIKERIIGPDFMSFFKMQFSLNMLNPRKLMPLNINETTELIKAAQRPTSVTSHAGFFRVLGQIGHCPFPTGTDPWILRINLATTTSVRYKHAPNNRNH